MLTSVLMQASLRVCQSEALVSFPQQVVDIDNEIGYLCNGIQNYLSARCVKYEKVIVDICSVWHGTDAVQEGRYMLGFGFPSCGS